MGKHRNENRPGYKKTNVGWIPEEWQYSRLEDVALVRTGPFGAQLHERDYVDDGTPIVTVEHLSEMGVLHRNLPLVSDEDKNRLSQYILADGDIVFSRVGSVDRNSIISVREEGWLFSGRLLRVRPTRKYIFPLYLSNYFHQQTFKNHMRNIAVGGTMASLNTRLLSRILIPLPPLPEQKAIASVLECWDKVIQKYEEKIEKKKNIKKGLMQRLLSGKQRIPGYDGEWQPKSVREFCKVIGGGTPSKTERRYWQGSIPWISSSDLAEDDVNCLYIKNHITNEAISNSATNLIPQDSVIVVTRVGVGKVAINREELCTSQDFQSLIYNSEIADEYYLAYAMLKQIKALACWNQGTSIAGILKKDLLNIRVPIPTHAEQCAIASILSSADSEIKALEKKLAVVKEQKKYLLNNLVTGTIRLPEFTECNEAE